MARQLERRGREAGQRIEGEADHFAQWVFGRAGEAFVAPVSEGDLFGPDPRDHAADESRLLGHGEKRIEGTAADQPEVARIDRNVDIGRARKEAIEAVCGRTLE